MKKEKIIAAVLAASMALSLTGCDSIDELLYILNLPTP